MSFFVYKYMYKHALKKIIFGIVIGLLVLMTATGFIYAYNKDKTNKGNNKQELNKGLDIFHITSSCNHGGTISPKGNQSVIKGEDPLTFTITVINSGYKLEWLRVDNVKYSGDSYNTYTFTNVEKNHTIHAHFKKIKQSKQ